MAPPKMTEKEFEEWMNGAFQGDPAEARAFCERSMSPNMIRMSAGGGKTTFEDAVKKIANFRTITKKWVAPVNLLVQEGNKLSARLTCEMITGDEPEVKMELMFMAERDEQGRFEKVWELMLPLAEEEESTRPS